ncbi:Signal transduction response regulator [Trema orientale]|uniref:Signal transduction response regulator n=1 Tax=Trema orientale TaxID=63057 RepID=A0A2P5EX37_TREOI|nr:Signal transduction response regulator [Trema orientale]
MLLRSSSAPILNSWLPHSKDSSPEPEPLLHLPRTKSVSLTCSFHSSSSPTDDPSKRPLQPVLTKSESPPKPKRKTSPTSKTRAKQPQTELEVERDEKGKLKIDSGSSSAIGRLFSSSGLGERFMKEEGRCVENKERVLQTLVMGGGVGSNGGRICGGGGGDGRGSGGGDGGDGGGGSGFFEGNSNNRGSDGTDVYYQKMIEANPGNGLLLGNYAKFLKEVRGDYAKAEEYYGRAILANPGDAEVLSLYADLIWSSHKDAQRAENYFDQAVKSSPDDCYVLASYARFLWDAEDEEEEDENEGNQPAVDHGHSSPPTFFHGAPLTA